MRPRSRGLNRSRPRHNNAPAAISALPPMQASLCPAEGPRAVNPFPHRRQATIGLEWNLCAG